MAQCLCLGQPWQANVRAEQPWRENAFVRMKTVWLVLWGSGECLAGEPEVCCAS